MLFVSCNLQATSDPRTGPTGSSRIIKFGSANITIGIKYAKNQKPSKSTIINYMEQSIIT